MQPAAVPSGAQREPKTMVPPLNARPAPKAAASSARNGTRIGNSISIKGDIIGDEDIYLDGIIEGAIKLESHTLTIGPNGNVQADVSARSVILLGNLKGNVRASGHVEIRRTGSFEGDILASRIIMEDGAGFRGSIDITKPKKAQVVPSRNKPVPVHQTTATPPKPNA